MRPFLLFRPGGERAGRRAEPRSRGRAPTFSSRARSRKPPLSAARLAAGCPPRRPAGRRRGRRGAPLAAARVRRAAARLRPRRKTAPPSAARARDDRARAVEPRDGRARGRLERPRARAPALARPAHRPPRALGAARRGRAELRRARPAHPLARARRLARQPLQVEGRLGRGRRRGLEPRRGRRRPVQWRSSRYPELRAAAARSGAVLVEEIDRDPLMGDGEPLPRRRSRSARCSASSCPARGATSTCTPCASATPFGLVRRRAPRRRGAHPPCVARDDRARPEPLEKEPDRKRMRTVQRILTGIPDADGDGRAHGRDPPREPAVLRDDAPPRVRARRARLSARSSAPLAPGGRVRRR